MLVEGLREQAGSAAAEAVLERVVITRTTLAEGARSPALPQAVDVLAAGAGAGVAGRLGGADVPVKCRPVWQAASDGLGALRAGQVAAVLG